MYYYMQSTVIHVRLEIGFAIADIEWKCVPIMKNVYLNKCEKKTLG